MFKNSSNMIFIFVLMTGTMITISSNSWLGVWMGLEINLLSFIPLMISVNNLMSTEASLKYFLTQAFASSLLLFSIVMYMFINNMYIQIMNINYYSYMMFISLLIKSGVAPFHFWFTNVNEGLSWYSSFILMTWQKIAPMILLTYFSIFNIFYLIILITVTVGAIGGLNQTSLRKILAYSSINHMGWMMTATIFNEYLWIFYFLIYTIISFSVIFFFNSFKMFYINQLFNMFVNSYLMKFLYLITFLSLSGLPPFLGFLPKWMVIQNLIIMNHMFLVFLMIMMSLITMYFYLRICYSAVIMNYSEINWNMNMYQKNNLSKTMAMFTFISIFGLFMFLSMINILF